MARSYRFAAATMLAAAFSLAATPADARGYHHYHHHHHDHVDTGDVIAGVAIFGAIAAIASAASHADRHDGPPPPQQPLPDDRQGYGYDGAPRDMGLDRAADQCVAAVERGSNRADYVDSVARDPEGWSVSGALVGGAQFSCRIGNDGRVTGVNVGGPPAQSSAAPYRGDNAPRSPRADAEDDGAPPADDRPVWQDPSASSAPEDDGRYDTSDAPDFGQAA